MNKNILVIAAHSDDEALGCSGAIAKHIKQGDSVHLLFMTNGVGSRSGKRDDKKRLTAAQDAAQILEVSSFTNIDFKNESIKYVFRNIVDFFL